MKDWPAGDKPARFTDILEPLCAALEEGLALGERVYDAGLSWDGLEIGRSEQATCLLVAEALTGFQLRFSIEDQGRDWKQELLGIAVRLGIEQGRRIYRSSVSSKTLANIAGAELVWPEIPELTPAPVPQATAPERGTYGDRSG